ncbi:hypothetical protein HZA57_05070, partial [Candidatus Poribacteria bacterium]|nr:hypothetical protein [Candidatus Poribacteria bacterium]
TLSLLGIVIGGDVLARRLEHLLRITDRLNYYASGLIFLREHPLGLGLGMHFQYYDQWFTPWFRHYQTDHVTSHSLPLHMLIENGPAVPLLFGAGVLFLLFETRRAWPSYSPGLRGIVLALWMGLGGILIDGAAQYFFYIRAVEFTFWVLAGFSLGLARRECAANRPRGGRTGIIALLLLTGAVAIVMARSNVRRNFADSPLRPWDPIPGSSPMAFAQWTGRSLRMPIDPGTRAVSFSLYRQYRPGHVKIGWPDGVMQAIEMRAGETLTLRHELKHEAGGLLAPRKWLTLEVDSTMTPHRWDPFTSPDERHLGIYVNEFRLEYGDEAD